MRIPDTKVAWSEHYTEGVRFPLLGETLEMNPWADGICAVPPGSPQPPHVEYDGR